MEYSGDRLHELLLEYGGSYKRYLGIGSAFSLGARWMELVPVLMLAIAIDSIILDERPYALPLVPDGWIPGSTMDQLYLTVAIVAAAFIIESVLHVMRIWGLNAFAQRLQHDLRKGTYDNVQMLSMEYFGENPTGDIISIMNNDINSLDRFLTSSLSDFFEVLFLVIGVTIVLSFINWQLTLVAVLPVVLIAGFTYLWSRRLRSVFLEVRKSIGQFNTRLEDNVTGMRVIKTNTTEAFESDRVADSSSELYHAKWDAVRAQYPLYPGIKLSAGFGITLTFLLGGLWIISDGGGLFTGTLTAGQFVMFFAYTQRLIWPAAEFGSIVKDYQEADAAAQRITGIMDEDHYIEEVDDASELTVTNGDVAFDDVSFKYNKDEEWSIENVDFDVDGGAYVGVVGPTGAGKSTLFRLLLRLNDHDSGSIRIDGQDIHGVTIESLRQSIGYVGQNTFLFSGTIRENIAYGNPDAEFENIVKAAKNAEAHEFITNLSEGYDTHVGERGSKLSGGQRRRIAIARTLIKDPDILLLDEATSDVDTETELLIQRSLDRLTEETTTFTIAHRLSTVRHADTLLVVEDGKLVQQGSHEELISQDGLYKNFWEIQTGEIDSLSDSFVDSVVERRAQAPQQSN